MRPRKVVGVLGRKVGVGACGAGRKRTHAVSLSLAAIAMLLSASAPGVTSYAVFRCVCGVGVGGVNVVAYVWACEPIGQVSGTQGVSS